MNHPNVSEPVYTLQATGDSRCFAGYGRGLFASDNGGITWKYAYQSLLGDAPLPTVSLLHVNGDLFAGVSGAVLRSKDGGSEWQVARLPDPEPLVVALTASPHFTEDGVLFAGTAEDGVYISSDQGESWAVWNFGLLDPNVLSLAVTDAVGLFAGVSSGLFRSQNRGRSWSPVLLPSGYDAVLSICLSSTFDRDGVGYLGTEEYGVLSTPDGGASWVLAENAGLDGPVNSLASGPDGRVVALVNTALMVSNDSAKTWQPWPFSTILQGIVITALSAPQGFGPGLPVWVGTSDGQVLKIA
jgi:photosystem II stability/assembly factor-like uncharacterized protein